MGYDTGFCKAASIWFECGLWLGLEIETGFQGFGHTNLPNNLKLKWVVKGLGHINLLNDLYYELK